MKKTKRATILPLGLLLLAGAGATGVLTACRRGPAETSSPARKWYCPMHPAIVKDAPGDCPICNMKLVPVGEPAAGTTSTPASKGPRKILFYRSPMDPRQTSPTLRKDEMGMDYVPVFSDEAEAAGGGVEGFAAVTIDPDKERLIGLKTARVVRGPLELSIRTVGRVAFDERRVHHVHTRYEAFIEHIEADFTGKFVKKGEVLAQVYSPELYATQQEYLLALKASRTLGGSTTTGVAESARQLLEAAHQRLLLWEISPADIQTLEKQGEPLRTLNIYAPISGYVIARTAYHGMKVMPADSLFDIVDLSSVWVLADVYEYELPRLSVGQRAAMTLSYWPGREWHGAVTYVYPAVDEKTRTVKVRLEVANPAAELKPEMFANVVIRGRSRDVLQVPDDAVLDSGTRQIVFIALGDGKLSPREVALGDHASGMYEVRSGLAEGESVVLGANFLVDSESRLKAALSAMTAGAEAKKPSPPPAGHEHGEAK